VVSETRVKTNVWDGCRAVRGWINFGMVGLLSGAAGCHVMSEHTIKEEDHVTSVALMAWNNPEFQMLAHQ
jgi:hypothetical protein